MPQEQHSPPQGGSGHPGNPSTTEPSGYYLDSTAPAPTTRFYVPQSYSQNLTDPGSQFGGLDAGHTTQDPYFFLRDDPYDDLGSVHRSDLDPSFSDLASPDNPWDTRQVTEEPSSAADVALESKQEFRFSPGATVPDYGITSIADDNVTIGSSSPSLAGTKRRLASLSAQVSEDPEVDATVTIAEANEPVLPKRRSRRAAAEIANARLRSMPWTIDQAARIDARRVQVQSKPGQPRSVLVSNDRGTTKRLLPGPMLQSSPQSGGTTLFRGPTTVYTGVTPSVDSSSNVNFTPSGKRSLAPGPLQPRQVGSTQATPRTGQASATSPEESADADSEELGEDYESRIATLAGMSDEYKIRLKSRLNLSFEFDVETLRGLKRKQIDAIWQTRRAERNRDAAHKHRAKTASDMSALRDQVSVMGDKIEELEAENASLHEKIRKLTDSARANASTKRPTNVTDGSQRRK
ncbi:hypothetical protein I317_00580 [Kwoniella heveanensis CBS 569]|nr:hypothetical protein I317_00580 [Kwoniella heveanensis CBS 569]